MTIGRLRAFVKAARKHEAAAAAGAGRGTGRLRGSRVAAVAAMMALAACSYRGPALTLLDQRATWFSYLNGDDISAACARGGPDRYRMVYNADFNNQVRGYDVLPARDGGAVLRQVIDRGLTFTPGGVSPAQLFTPIEAETRLAPVEVEVLERLLEQSGVFAPPPVGLRLDSRSYYWLVTGCRNGHHFLTAFVYPSERFARLRFVPFLAAHDGTGVPVPPPQEVGIATYGLGCQPNRPDTAGCFFLEVGQNGLVGTRPLF